MANITLVVYTPDRAGGVNVGVNAQACTTSDTVFVPNDGRTKLIVTNASSGAAALVLDVDISADGLLFNDLTLHATLHGPSTYVWGPFPIPVYGTTLEFTVSTNTVSVTAITG